MKKFFALVVFGTVAVALLGCPNDSGGSGPSQVSQEQAGEKVSPKTAETLVQPLEKDAVEISQTIPESYYQQAWGRNWPVYAIGKEDGEEVSIHDLVKELAKEYHIQLNKLARSIQVVYLIHSEVGKERAFQGIFCSLTDGAKVKHIVCRIEIEKGRFKNFEIEQKDLLLRDDRPLTRSERRAFAERIRKACASKVKYVCEMAACVGYFPENAPAITTLGLAEISYVMPKGGIVLKDGELFDGKTQPCWVTVYYPFDPIKEVVYVVALPWVWATKSEGI